MSVACAVDEMRGEQARSKEALRLWLRLLGSVNLIEARLRARLRQEFGVTLAQFDLMAEIARDDRPKTMSEVSALLMVSNGNVTGVVDRLSREGLVTRTPSPDDRRAFLLALTPVGAERFAQIAQAHENWLGELLGALEPDIVQRLNRDLKRLRSVLKGEGP